MRSGRFDQVASGLPKWSMISFSPRWRSAIGPIACSRSGPSSAIGSPARSATGQSQSIVPSDNQVFWCGCSSAKRSPSIPGRPFQPSIKLRLSGRSSGKLPRIAILGNFPLDRPESRSLIDGWKGRPGMLGLRFALLQPHQKTWLSDGTMDWLWPVAERAGLPIALLGPDLLQAIGPIAERHRGLKLIIDHFGRPDASWSNLPDLIATAKHPNVALKATGAPSY